MGLVLDSGVLIAAERDAKPLSDLLSDIEREYGETEIVLSAITVIELEHGFYRARTAEQAQKRRDYPDGIAAAIPGSPFTSPMAQIVARIDARARQEGLVIPFQDLLIGATALHIGYAVGDPKPPPLPDDSRSGHRPGLRPLAAVWPASLNRLALPAASSSPGLHPPSSAVEPRRRG